MKIRKATGDDIPVLTGLVRNSFQDVAQRFHLTEADCPTHPSFCADEWIRRDRRAGKGFFLLEDEDPVGCVALEAASGGAGEIRRHRHHRRTTWVKTVVRNPWIPLDGNQEISPSPVHCGIHDLLNRGRTQYREGESAKETMAFARRLC
mgnify:CR=1 FL=1